MLTKPKTSSKTKQCVLWSVTCALIVLLASILAILIHSSAAIKIHNQNTIVMSSLIGYINPTIESTILSSEVIARVRLISVEATVASLEHAPTDPALDFVFQSIEYLKGNGGEGLVVRLPYQDLNLENQTEAMEFAEFWANAFRSSDVYQSSESIVFLEHYTLTDHRGVLDADDKTYGFAFAGFGSLSILPYYPRYDLDAAWLKQNLAKTGLSAQSDSIEYTATFPWDDNTSAYRNAHARAGLEGFGVVIENDVAKESDVLNLKLSEVEELIEELEIELSLGEGKLGYEECVTNKYILEALFDAGVYSREPYLIETTIPSGAKKHTIVDRLRDWKSRNGHYADLATSGADHGLIRWFVEDDDDDPATGFDGALKSTRPLPAGEYRFRSNVRLPVWVACDYNPYGDGEHNWIVTAAPPEGTLHEAFFDPAALTAPSDGVGVRYSPRTSFTLSDKTSVTLDYLYYAPGIVKMGTTPHDALSGYEMDIIELDGKVSSTFAFGGSGSTSSPHEWATCVQPWDVGDTLMLRIRKTGTGSASASAVTPCPTYTPTPTDTPTPEPEPTAMQTPSSTPVPEPTETPTPSPAP